MKLAELELCFYINCFHLSKNLDKVGARFVYIATVETVINVFPRYL
jgi:hypothetical protein